MMEADMETNSVPEHNYSPDSDYSKLTVKRDNSIKGLLNTFENSVGPVSIRLNAAYGTGKTTFLNQLRDKADKNKFVVLYYNAWEEEISLDARSSLCLAILKEIEKNSPEKKIDTKIASFQKVILPIIAKAGINALSRFLLGDHKALLEAFDAAEIGNTIADALKGGFKEAEQSRLQIHQIREALRKLITALGDKKILILIDELDRCRPDFAIEVLETIKHFFSIEKIFALVGVDENVLHSIIEKRYGSSIDCEGYLLRHFSSEMQFSDFSYSHYCINKCQEFGIPSDFHDNVTFICRGFGLKFRSINNFIGFLSSVFHSESKEKARDFGFFIFMFGIKMFDRQLFNCCLDHTRGKYFDERMKHLRSTADDNISPFQILLFLIQTSESDYAALVGEYNCKDLPGGDRYRNGGAPSGLHFYSTVVLGFYDFSNMQ